MENQACVLIRHHVLLSDANGVSFDGWCYTIEGIAASVGGIENPKLEYVCAAWQHFLL